MAEFFIGLIIGFCFGLLALIKITLRILDDDYDGTDYRGG